MAIWIEERDKAVWHSAVSRETEPLTYRAACGWVVSIRHGRIWPQKLHDPGPPDDDRCRSCVADR
jgi:hypothetical protein